MHNGKPLHKEAGISLIELMIGLLLSMIGVLAGLMLYQNLIRVSVESRTDASHDGQLASAMLQLQLQLQSAGYGIPNAGNDNVANPNDNQLYWRYVEGGNTVCRGMDVTTPGVTDLALRLLEAPCTLADALPNLPWQESARLAYFPRNPPEITIDLAASNCFPYGLGEPGNHYMVTVTAESSVRRGIDGDENNAVAPNSYNYCLPNVSQGGI